MIRKARGQSQMLLQKMQVGSIPTTGTKKRHGVKGTHLSHEQKFTVRVRMSLCSSYSLMIEHEMKSSILSVSS